MLIEYGEDHRFVVRVAYTLTVQIVLCLILQILMLSNEQRLHLPYPDLLRNVVIHLINYILNRLSFRYVVRTSTLFMNCQYTCRKIPKVGNTRGIDIPYHWIDNSHSRLFL